MDAELVKAVNELTDEDIKALAKEMDMPIRMNGNDFDREATISRLLTAGCENCGKKKKV